MHFTTVAIGRATFPQRPEGLPPAAIDFPSPFRHNGLHLTAWRAPSGVQQLGR